MNEQISFKRLRVLLIIFSILNGIYYGYMARFTISSDTVSYIDMAYRFLSHGYEGLLNGIWSPLYPFFLGISFFIFKPNSYWEFPVLHITLFFFFLFSLSSFNFLFLSFIKYHQKIKRNDVKKSIISLDNSLFCTCAYLLFTIASVFYWREGPDILFGAFNYLIIGIILNIFLKPSNKKYYLVLGLCFGIGFLAKAPMLPLSIVYLGILFSKIKGHRLNLLFPIIIFALIISPYVFALSKHKGFFTLGESGKLNCAWYVNDIPLFAHWQGNEKIKLLHQTRQLYTKPNLYEFAKPMFGVYPPWTDPSYWYEGVKPKFDLVGELECICASLKTYVEMYITRLGFLTGATIFLIFLSTSSILKNYLILILPPFISFGIFSLIHLEPRYISFLLPVLFLGVAGSLRFNRNKETIRTLNKFSQSTFLVLLLFFSIFFGAREFKVAKSFKHEHESWAISQALKKEGIISGDHVAIIGYSIPISPFWAVSGKLKVVSEILEEDTPDFWDLSKDKKEDIFNIFKSTGAKALIIKEIPPGNDRSSYKELYKKGPYLKIL